MDKGIAQRARHLFVDFGDDNFCYLGWGLYQSRFDAQAAETMLIWWAHLDEDSIKCQVVFLEEDRNLG